MKNPLEEPNEKSMSIKYSGEGVLDNFEKQLDLAKRLKNVYDNRPDPATFVGAMQGTDQEGQYTEEEIKKDIEYVLITKQKIEKSNRERGNISVLEGGFAISEMMQAMIVDRINKGMFSKFKAEMTSERDDLKVGVDAVLKRDADTYLGAAFDFTVAANPTTIEDKLQKEWREHIEKHSIPVVKYYQDPDTKQKQSLMTPRFIIGGAKRDIENFASMYLEGREDELNNHPFKYLMINQIEQQLKSAIHFFEKNADDPSYGFIHKQYKKIALAIDELKKDVSYNEFTKGKDFFDYKKSSVAYNAMKDFYEDKF